MSADLTKILESKRRTRRELQALPFEEKLRILERLREDLIIGLANQRNTRSELAAAPQTQTGSASVEYERGDTKGKPQHSASQQSAKPKEH